MHKQEAGEYRLIVSGLDGTREYAFTTFEALCVAAWRNASGLLSNRYWYSGEEWVRLDPENAMTAYSPKGKTYAILEIATAGKRFHFGQRELYRPGDGPVPRTSKWRGGYWKRPARIAQAHRQAQALEEDVPGRPARNTALFDARDGRNRIRQRSWKEQFHGRKAWDRAGRRSRSAPYRSA